MNFFSTNAFSGTRTMEELRCKCGSEPKVVRKMMDPSRGLTVRMFECQCGERTWTESKG
jgi:hypothetical protein